MNLLQIENLSYSIRKPGRLLSLSGTWKEILRGISLLIQPGTTLGLIGESGSGKSTLARCIAGLLRPTSGRICFSGIELFPCEENRIRIGSQIQLLFQNHTTSLDPLMTIRKSLLEGVQQKAHPLHLSKKKSDSRTCRSETETEYLLDLLSMVGLPPDILDRRPAEISGGQRQRVALARALSVSPELLILDEPTSALDVLTQAQILETIKRIQKQTNLSILYITHDIGTALTMANEIAVLKDGSIIERGSRDQLAHHATQEYTRALFASGSY